MNVLKKFFFVLLFVLIFFSEGEAGIVLKVSARNPSKISERETMVTLYLPKNITPDNIIEKGNLDLGYDVKRNQYYVSKKVVLKKEEAVSYDVEIEDIWLIPIPLLDKLQNHADELLNKLRFTQYYRDANEIKDFIDQNIELIKSVQEENDVQIVTPVEHLGAYFQNQETLKKVKEDIGILEQLVLVNDGNPGTLMGERSIGTKREQPAQEASQGESDEQKKVKKYKEVSAETCLDEESLKDEKGSGIFGEKSTIAINFQLENPSYDTEKTFPVKYFLPKEVKAEDVVDAKGLDVSYDFSEEQYYVYNEGVKLEAGETRKFEVVVKDKWLLEKTEVLALKLHLEMIALQLKKNQEKQKSSEITLELIPKLREILEMRSPDVLTKEHVADYYRAQGTFDSLKKQAFDLEDILTKRGINPSVYFVNDEILCEEMQASREDKTIVEKFFKKKQRPDILKHILFQGEAPDMVTLWRIIFGVIVVLGGFATIFYAIWSGKAAKDEQYTKLNPTLKEKDPTDKK